MHDPFYVHTEIGPRFRTVVLFGIARCVPHFDGKPWFRWRCMAKKRKNAELPNQWIWKKNAVEIVHRSTSLFVLIFGLHGILLFIRVISNVKSESVRLHNENAVICWVATSLHECVCFIFGFFLFLLPKSRTPKAFSFIFLPCEVDTLDCCSLLSENEKIVFQIGLFLFLKYANLHHGRKFEWISIFAQQIQR